jgi:hypothetical protein
MNELIHYTHTLLIHNLFAGDVNWLEAGAKSGKRKSSA